MKELVISNYQMPANTRKRFDIKVAKLYDHTNMRIPVEVIRGAVDGPTLFVSAAIHGDELNGVEVIRKLLTRRGLLKKIRGTLIAVPIVNVFGFNNNLRYLPDRRDLNRSFPGSEKGSLAAQIAYKFMNEIVRKCDYGIDLHTATSHRFNLPQIRVCLDDPEMDGLARSFGAPVVLHSNIRDGSLRQAANDLGIKTLLFEGGEALRYDKKIIKLAERGILFFMQKIGMLESNDLPKHLTLGSNDSVKVFCGKSSYWMRAPQSGIMNMNKRLGHKVRQGEIIAEISDPFCNNKIYVRARSKGVIIGINLMPLVNNGDALVHIASFADSHIVSEELVTYGESLEVIY